MGGLRRARDLLRPVVDGPLEYRMRRGIGRLLPVADATGPPHLFHACVWKTASQWVRLILSDPRILRSGGHAPFVWAHLRDLPRHARSYHRTPRTLLLAGYGTPEVICARPDPMRGIFVIRDPRALLASWISSTRYTHRPNAGVMAHRSTMEAMGQGQALDYAARAFAAEFGPVLDGWLATGPYTLRLRFEDLTGPEGPQVWGRALDHMGLSVTRDVRDAVLHSYRIEALAGPVPATERADKYALRGCRDLDWVHDYRGKLPVLEPIFDWARAYGYTN